MALKVARLQAPYTKATSGPKGRRKYFAGWIGCFWSPGSLLVEEIAGAVPITGNLSNNQRETCQLSSCPKDSQDYRHIVKTHQPILAPLADRTSSERRLTLLDEPHWQP
jgi:hypothetical protein